MIFNQLFVLKYRLRGMTKLIVSSCYAIFNSIYSKRNVSVLHFTASHDQRQYFVYNDFKLPPLLESLTIIYIYVVSVIYVASDLYVAKILCIYAMEITCRLF